MTAIPQIEKTQFENNTGGWLGVVIIDPKGQDRGVSVEPGGTIWLSEAEQRLTANAPRKPEDNPFIEQTLERRDETTGELESYEVVPLTVKTDMRFVPAETRPIPVTATPTGLQHAQAAARGDEPVLVTEATAPALQRTRALEDAPPTIHPNEPVVPRRAAEAAAAAQGTEETATTVEGGEEAVYAPGETTGAATPPAGDAPEGEYGSNEEVGTPVEESNAGTEIAESGEPTQPEPWQG